MKWVSLAAVLGSLGAGLWAAWLWYLSSRVRADPNWQRDYVTGIPIQPADPMLTQMSWTDALLRASKEAADLNARAAFWTAITVVLGTLAGLASWIGSNWYL